MVVAVASPHDVAVCIRRPATVVHSVPVGSVNAPTRDPVTLPVVGAASNAVPSNAQGSLIPARREAVEALTEVGLSPETFPCNTTFASRCVLFCSFALRTAAAAVLLVLFAALTTKAAEEELVWALELPGKDGDGGDGGVEGGGGGGAPGGGTAGGAVGVPPTARCWPVTSS